ncbi:MAG: hypothetical protein RIR00_1693 [Pseudomonadota bacterium]|jgi:Smg protein
MNHILAFFFENYREFSSCPDSDALAEQLGELGFDPEDVGAAIAWLDSLTLAPLAAIRPGSLRIYPAFEVSRIGAENLGFLTQLEQSGAIDAPLRELVIDRVFVLNDEPLPLAHFRVILLIALWRQEREIDPLLLSELLNDLDQADPMH